MRCIKKIKDLAEAVEIINASQFGHTAVIYTENGGEARDFVRLCDTGQIGIKVGTPAPIAFYLVGGRRTLLIRRPAWLRQRCHRLLYRQEKVIVARWLSSIDVPDSVLKQEAKIF